MFKELTKYKNCNHFTFATENELSEVCNAPQEGNGIYLVYEVNGDEKELLFVGSTGTIQTSASFPNGTVAIDQRVVYGGSLFFYVTQVLYTDPGGIQWSVSSAGAGLTFCPATTTSTTTIQPLAIVVTISCDNTQPGSTYLGKASVAITGGSGIYQIKAGFVPTYSTLEPVTTDPFVITSPTSTYDGTLGLRNTTGGSDKFLVYVIDSFGTIVTSASDINCTVTTTTAAP